MKKALIWLAAVALLAGGGYYFYGKKKAAAKDAYVTEAVKRGDITSSVSATGKLNPKVSVLVGTEVSGTIRQIYVDNNSAVRKGQVLLKLDQDIFLAQVEQARANLGSAQARLREVEAGRPMQRSEVKTSIEQKKATLDKDKADFDRKQELFSKGMIARGELDLAREAFLVSQALYEQAVAEKAKDEVTDAQVAAAEAAVRQARAGLNTAETNLSKTVIRAPMDGIVINKNVEVGQTVAASFTTPNLLDIGDLSVMEVEVSIDEADVGQVAVGKKAEFTVDAFPEKVFEGKVARIYYAPVTVQNVVTYTGIIEVKNPDALLRPGMTANVNIITDEKKGVLLVPNPALRVKMDVKVEKAQEAPAGSRTVWVMKDGKPAPASVRTGVTDFVNTEVVSGLGEGDLVVVEAPTNKAGSNPRGQGRNSSRGMMRMAH